MRSTEVEIFSSHGPAPHCSSAKTAFRGSSIVEKALL